MNTTPVPIMQTPQTKQAQNNMALLNPMVQQNPLQQIVGATGDSEEMVIPKAPLNSGALQ